MKAFRSIATALAGASLLVLASCGGGDAKDEGGLTALNVIPAAITLTGPNTTTCGSGSAGRVYVFGGNGPYKIVNTFPANVVVSQTEIEQSGDYFDLVFLGGCMDNVVIGVIDDKGRQVTVSLSAVVGD